MTKVIVACPASLLADVLDVLYRDAGDFIHNCSLLDRVGEDTIPREGTMDPDCGARPKAEQPGWLIEIIGRQRRL